MTDTSNRPSKQFIKRGAIAIGIVTIILVAQTQWVRNLFHKSSPDPIVNTTVGDVIIKDTNGNGIADWEEKLWGLDPTVLYTNGIPNKQIIEEKKKAAGITDTDTPEVLDDTDRLARELFTLTSALGQSDDIDSATLQAIAAKLGSSVDIKQVNNQYSLKDIQTVQTTLPNLTTYRSAIRTILGRYDSNTPDIEVLITALENEDVSNLPQLTQSAATYQKLAKELSTVKVPLGLAQQHLTMINSFAGVGTSFTYMTELNDNSIIALVGVAIYKTYSTKIYTTTSTINDYFAQYGIL